jgi:hypothetical protein
MTKLYNITCAFSSTQDYIFEKKNILILKKQEFSTSHEQEFLTCEKKNKKIQPLKTKKKKIQPLKMEKKNWPSKTRTKAFNLQRQEQEPSTSKFLK